LLAKEASDLMLASVTGYADAFWRPPAWYLTILEDLLPNPGQEKIEKWRNFLLEWRNFLLEWRNFL
jgi:hypothetical protein